jgi:hypothetical protein
MKNAVHKVNNGLSVTYAGESVSVGYPDSNFRFDKNTIFKQN